MLFWIFPFIATAFSVNIYVYDALRFLSAWGNIGAYLSMYVLGKSYFKTIVQGPVLT